ncbi:hypothetical protein EB796_024265 [Bugula neritina]|uniref:Uncharacterized protein n=1 Tax=Bugula neritina TaxID=10212 RepID=A0A7J7IU32_BUGNE|nr:hypothetical protein EB796_024265 [Bugula neritina]
MQYRSQTKAVSSSPPKRVNKGAEPLIVLMLLPADLRKKIAELAGELEDTQDRLNQSVEYNQQLEHT